MQGTRIYSAPSLAEVIKYLWLYRASGLLSIRPAVGIVRDQAHITMEYGHPIRIRWGMYEGDVKEAMLRQLNAWGEIHFMFQSRVPLLSLPSPSQSFQQEQPRLPKQPIKLPHSHLNLAGPQALSSRPVPTDKMPAVPPSVSDTRSLKQANGTNSSGPGNLYALAPETVLPARTPNASQYPIANLTHHDRAIFLLIDGQRTVADLIALTKRSLADVYNTLYSLRDEQLIVMRQTLPGHK